MDDLGTGWEHQRAGRLSDAEACYRRFLASHPNDAEGWRVLGVVAFRQQNLDEAIRCYLRSLALQPGTVDVLTNLGVAYAVKGDLAAAELSLRQATAVRPPFIEAYRNLGHALRDQDKLAEAIQAYQQARMLRPDDIDILGSLGSVLQKANRAPEAIEPLFEAVRLVPRAVNLHQLLGNVLRDQDRFAEALACYETAAELRPDSVEAHYYAGVMLGRVGRFGDSIHAFDRVLGLNPKHPDARKNRALMKLKLGDYIEGFAEYESRWECSTFVRPDFTQPLWNGEPIAGKTILLVAEQGLGDTIQFIRFAPRVKARGATVVLRCFRPLLKLFAKVAGIDVVIPEGEPLPTFDVYAPLISLAAIFGTSLEDVPGVHPVPYLQADPALVERWRDRLGPRAPGELRVGIFWQGSPTYGSDRFRSAPLEAFCPLAAVPGVKLISLQKNQGVEQIAPLIGRLPIVDFGDELDRESGPFQDSAALLSLVDLMVTINSAPVHLAGALGVPTWLALSTDTDWRWTAGREDSPWYPTVRIFRQMELYNWSEVFERMAPALADLAASPRRGATV